MEPAKREFEALITPHLDALYRAAWRLTRRRVDAEDLVQEVCLRACRELEQLRQLESVRGWLLRVQYRLFVDLRRRFRRSPVRSFDEHEQGIDEVMSPIPGPEDSADAALRHEQLERAWNQLSADQKALLALHAEGYGLDELEQIIGSNRNALSARLHRARRRLAKCLRNGFFSLNELTTTVSSHEL